MRRTKKKSNLEKRAEKYRLPENWVNRECHLRESEESMPSRIVRLAHGASIVPVAKEQNTAIQRSLELQQRRRYQESFSTIASSQTMGRADPSSRRKSSQSRTRRLLRTW